jgi:LPXTG-site transpeptidase (sortase) family protein
MLIDGHISSWTTPGVFYNLNKLRAGDNIQIQKGDGGIIKYSVVKTVVYSTNNIDMNQVLNPIDSSKPGLNLISCFGDVISGTNEFNKRIVVYTSQQ